MNNQQLLALPAQQQQASLRTGPTRDTTGSRNTNDSAGTGLNGVNVLVLGAARGTGTTVPNTTAPSSEADGLGAPIRISDPSTHSQQLQRQRINTINSGMP